MNKEILNVQPESYVKTKIMMLIGMMCCFTTVAPAMVIHNYSNDKNGGIRSESGSFNEDYLFLGQDLDFSGEAEDLVFLGRRLTFSGKTKLGLFAACRRLIFSGACGNGIMAAGMDIVINGRITGNNYFGCRSFTMGDMAVVNGNLFIGCSDLTINGILTSDLYAGAGRIIINNEIQGNVKAYTRRIIIGEKGRINGNLFYSAREKLSPAESAKVTGTIVFDEHAYKRGRGFPGRVGSAAAFFITLGLFISFTVAGIVLLLLPVFRRMDGKIPTKAFWSTALWGLIPVFLYPVIIVFSFILVITIPFAFVLLLAYIPLFFFAYLIGTTLLGKYLVTLFNWNVEKRHYQFLIGTLAGLLLSLIPIVNLLYMIFISALGWGVFLSFLFNKNLSGVE